MLNYTLWFFLFFYKKCLLDVEVFRDKLHLQVKILVISFDVIPVAIQEPIEELIGMVRLIANWFANVANLDKRVLNDDLLLVDPVLFDKDNLVQYEDKGHLQGKLILVTSFVVILAAILEPIVKLHEMVPPIVNWYKSVVNLRLLHHVKLVLVVQVR